MRPSITVIKNKLLKNVLPGYIPLMNNMARSGNGWKEFLAPLEEYITKRMMDAYTQGYKAQWINPIKTGMLPTVGDKVLFSTGGKTYYGSFIENDYFKEGQGATAKLYDACDCVWMYLPQYKETK